jgi:hypothetical protein
MGVVRLTDLPNGPGGTRCSAFVRASRTFGTSVPTRVPRLRVIVASSAAMDILVEGVGCGGPKPPKVSNLRRGLTSTFPRRPHPQRPSMAGRRMLSTDRGSGVSMSIGCYAVSVPLPDANNETALSAVGHSRPGPAGRRSSDVRYAPKATVGHQNTIGRDGPISDICKSKRRMRPPTETAKQIEAPTEVGTSPFVPATWR